MTEYGVRRLVAINSGKYSYANIDLSRPVHLAAPNNRGKSTLVNALQFLYIDDFERMRFSRRSHEDTKRHYFGEDRSYLIFECLTKSGVQCMLVRGLSNLRGGNFERYVYDGGFRDVDFVKDGEILEFEKVRILLADRHLARVKNSELWQVLAGNVPTDDDRNVPRLGILPIRRRDEYHAFRDVFVRLLSLTNADARTLRQLIIESHARDVGERKIDPATEYKDDFDRAERSERELEFIRAATPEIEECRPLRLEVQALKDKCYATAPTIWTDAVKCLGLFQTEQQRLNEELTGLADQRTDMESRKQIAIDRLVDVKAELKQLGERRTNLLAKHEKWSAYSNGLIEEMRRNSKQMSAQIADLDRQLALGTKLDGKAIQQRVEQLEHQISIDKDAIKRWKHTVVAELQKAGVPPEEIESAFRVANPEILRLIVGETLRVADLETAVARIREIAIHVSGDEYIDSCVEIDLSRVTKPDLVTLASAEELRRQVEVKQHELDQNKSLLKTITNRNATIALSANLKLECKRLQDDLNDYDEYLKNWARHVQLDEEVEKAQNAAAASSDELNAIVKQLEDLVGEKSRIQRELGSLNDVKEKLNAEARRVTQEAKRLSLEHLLPVCDLDTEIDVTQLPQLSAFVDSTVRQLSSLTIDLVRIDAHGSRIRSLEATVSAKSRQCETQERYFNDADHEWQKLVDAADSLPQLEQATKRQWDALATTLIARVNALVAAVGSIKLAVERINRGLRDYRVSNLREVHIHVEVTHDTFSMLEALSKQGTLFQDRQETEIARKRLRQMIDRKETIELDSLFELRIKIHETDGTVNQAASLDEIGSTGTGMTAKAMIFIQLMRAIAGNEKYRLHFYIDGLGELDDRNLEATSAMAVSRGIIPITADPRLHFEPLAQPEVMVYTLGQDTTDGRFYIDRYRTYYARRESKPAVTTRE